MYVCKDARNTHTQFLQLTVDNEIKNRLVTMPVAKNYWALHGYVCNTCSRSQVPSYQTSSDRVSCAHIAKCILRYFAYLTRLDLIAYKT